MALILLAVLLGGAVVSDAPRAPSPPRAHGGEAAQRAHQAAQGDLGDGLVSPRQEAPGVTPVASGVNATTSPSLLPSPSPSLLPPPPFPNCSLPPFPIPSPSLLPPSLFPMPSPPLLPSPSPSRPTPSSPRGPSSLQSPRRGLVQRQTLPFVCFLAFFSRCPSLQRVGLATVMLSEVRPVGGQQFGQQFGEWLFGGPRADPMYDPGFATVPVSELRDLTSMSTPPSAAKNEVFECFMRNVSFGPSQLAGAIHNVVCRHSNITNAIGLSDCVIIGSVVNGLRCSGGVVVLRSNVSNRVLTGTTRLVGASCTDEKMENVTRLAPGVPPSLPLLSATSMKAGAPPTTRPSAPPTTRPSTPPAEEHRAAKRARTDGPEQGEGAAEEPMETNAEGEMGPGQPCSAAVGYGPVITSESLLVLQQASEHALVEVFAADGARTYVSDMVQPLFKNNELASYAEVEALQWRGLEYRAAGEVPAIIGRVAHGGTLRITSTIEMWVNMTATTMLDVVAKVVDAGGFLSIVTGRGDADTDTLTHRVQQRVYGTGVHKGHATVARCEAHKDFPRYGEVFILVTRSGKCKLEQFAGEWNPNAFGNVKVIEDKYVELRRRAVEYGMGSEVLRAPAELVKSAFDSLTKAYPLLLKTYQGTATKADYEQLLFTDMQPWVTTLPGADVAGANYILAYQAGTVTTLYNELNSDVKVYPNVLGKRAIMSHLRQCMDDGKGLLPVIAINSGETINGMRPLLHGNDAPGGNTLPRMIARAMASLGLKPGLANIRFGWTSASCVGNDIQCGDIRMVNEAVYNILLSTQQGPGVEVIVPLEGHIQEQSENDMPAPPFTMRGSGCTISVT